MSLYTVYVSSIFVLCVQTLVWHAAVRHIHHQNAGHRALQQWCLGGYRHALRANCKGTQNTRPMVTSCSALHAGMASEGNHSSMSACRSGGMHGSLVSVCGGRGEWLGAVMMSLFVCLHTYLFGLPLLQNGGRMTQMIHIGNWRMQGTTTHTAIQSCKSQSQTENGVP